MSHQYLNLTSDAWRQLRRNWKLAPSPLLLWQTSGPGALFSTLTALQKSTNRDQLKKANLRNAVVVLGYWRSGTTLLHELLCLDTRYTFPTTHACMNPHHFLMTEASALAREVPGVQRPMDEMEVRPSSPQEDEFALLSLGARSPYEALLVPQHLTEALRLADPRDLTASDERQWRSVFVSFLSGVSVRGEGRPLILKSPTHGFRVSTLRDLLPDARYVLITRDPATHFESVVRMWRRMFEIYSLQPILSDDNIRQDVLTDRVQFENKLTEGTAGLPANRLTAISYESLVGDLVGTTEQLYRELELGDFGPVREKVVAEAEKRSGYRAQGYQPKGQWRERINDQWSPIIGKYGYQPL